MMKKRYHQFFFLAALLFGQHSFAQVSPATMKQIQLLLTEKTNRTPAQRKIDSRLLQAVREFRGEKMAASVNLDHADVNADLSGMLKVDIKADITDAFLSKITSLGGTIIYASPAYHTVRALVSLKTVEKIAAYPEVKFIEPAVKSMVVDAGLNTAKANTKFEERAAKVRTQLTAYMAKHVTEGSVTSQGDVDHRADDVRSTYGFLGQGIKIGVLSDSYNSKGKASSDVTKGDLPGTGNPDGYTTPVTVVQDFSGGSDEGRAMLQVIHDLAPAATLYFATADISEAGFASNIQTLRSTYGCNIIVDDVAYFDEPAFQDGITAQAVNTVTAAGALYFSSAGNSGSLAKGTAGVFEGDFNDAGSNPFSGGTKAGTIHNFGTVSSPVNGDIITAAGGVYNLNWADPMGASSNDYDLFLVSSAGSVKGSSTNIQSGTQNPYEQVNAGTLANGDRLVVFKTTSAAVRAFHLNTNRGTLAVATNGQTTGHACAANAFCMAATPAATAFTTGYPTGPYPNPFVSTNKVEPFSSDGPRKKFYNPDGSAITSGAFTFASNGGVTLAKPDLTAADGVKTTFSALSGLSPFFGTSCAAPHAGAIAALLLSGNPSLTTMQVRNILTSTALDVESSGYDNVSGYGIIQAFQAAGQVGGTTSCTAPTGLAVSNISMSSAVASWSPVTGAITYTVQYKDSASTAYKTDSLLTINADSLVGLSASTKYYFKVQTICSNGSSSLSTIDSFTTDAVVVTACNATYDGIAHSTFATAVKIPLGTSVNGTISSATDVDYYKFNITSKGTGTITLSTLPADYDLYLYDGNQKQAGVSKKTGTTTETINNHNFGKTGGFYVKVISKKGAFNASSCYTLTVTLGTAVGNTENKLNNQLPVTLSSSFRVFPNPVTSVLTVSTPAAYLGAAIKVTDIFGRTISVREITGSNSQIDVSKLPAGTYILTVISKDGRVENTSKFVKE